MTKRTLYHSSAKKIENGTIERCEGLFDTFLCFASNESKTNENKYLYSIEVDEDDIFNYSEIFYEKNCDLADEIIKETQELFAVKEETARNLLDGSKELHKLKNYEKIIQDNDFAHFNLQLLQTRACAALGHKVIYVNGDYMIDMLERENELKLVEE